MTTIVQWPDQCYLALNLSLVDKVILSLNNQYIRSAIYIMWKNCVFYLRWRLQSPLKHINSVSRLRIPAGDADYLVICKVNPRVDAEITQKKSNMVWEQDSGRLEFCFWNANHSASLPSQNTGSYFYIAFKYFLFLSLPICSFIFLPCPERAFDLVLFFKSHEWCSVTCFFCCEADKATVTDLWENNLSTLSTVCIMLDDMHCPNTYKDLATLLRIPRSTLRTFKYEDSGESPSKSVLEILETQKPNLSTDEMIIALTELGLPGIAAELLKLPGGWIAWNINLHIYQ